MASQRVARTGSRECQALLGVAASEGEVLSLGTPNWGRQKAPESAASQGTECSPRAQDRGLAKRGSGETQPVTGTGCRPGPAAAGTAGLAGRRLPIPVTVKLAGCRRAL